MVLVLKQSTITVQITL